MTGSRTHRRLILDVNPLVQLAVGFGSLFASFWIRDLDTALWALGAYGLAAALFLPGWRYPLVCLAFASIAAVTIVYSTWRLGGHDEREAVKAGLRIVVLAWPGSVMAGYVDPQRLADQLAQRLGLPDRFVAAFAAALEKVTGLGLTWAQLERVRRARGVGPSHNPVVLTRHAGAMSFALLVQALRGASQSSIAMDARGFASAHRRTWAEPATWTRLDSVALVVGIALACVAVVVALAG